MIQQTLQLRPPAVIPPTVRVPVRLQRSRKRGARTPTGAVYVGRPTMFGNPFRMERFGHARAVLLYGDWLEGRLFDPELERLGFCPIAIEGLHRHRERVLRAIHRLRRRDLVCWCPLTSKWCHADVLLKHANEDLPGGALFAAAQARSRPQ